MNPNVSIALLVDSSPLADLIDSVRHGKRKDTLRYMHFKVTVNLMTPLFCKWNAITVETRKFLERDTHSLKYTWHVYFLEAYISIYGLSRESTDNSFYCNNYTTHLHVSLRESVAPFSTCAHTGVHIRLINDHPSVLFIEFSSRQSSHFLHFCLHSHLLSSRPADSSSLASMKEFPISKMCFRRTLPYRISRAYVRAVTRD